MNKDVIYIEPEDDITDLIAKIKASPSKIVALVPPKKPEILRSLVNIKLISKAGISTQKSIVLVTTDEAIIKLAAAAKLPVTKNLKSAPVIPETVSALTEASESTETVDENGQSVDESAVSDSDNREDDEIEDDATEDESEDEEDNTEEEEDSDEEDPATKKEAKKAEKAAKKAAKAAKTFQNPFINWLYQHRKLAIFTGLAVVFVIVFGIWAFGIAPAATVDLTIKTTSTNFSESVRFTTNLADENTEEGIFYLDEKKLESKSEVIFEATGVKNVGETATGNVIVYTFFKEKGTIAINAGTLFSNSGLSYTADEGVTLSWNRTDTSVCENFNSDTFFTSGCQVSARIPVTATGSGSKYNLAATKTGWTTSANVAVYTDTAISGGTDETVTVVSQADVVNAIQDLAVENEELNKEDLLATLDTDGYFVIDTSFRETAGNTIVTPAVGEEVGENKKATLSVTTTDSIYVVEKTKIKDFVAETTKLADGFKIYSMNDPFIENFTETENGSYLGKLKAVVLSGPEITENKVIEIVKGKGFGTAQHDLADINGITSVRVTSSYPWVFTVPTDPNRITVNINTEEK